MNRTTVSTISALVKPLIYSFRAQQAMLNSPLYLFKNLTTCSAGDFSCFLQSFSSCNDTNIQGCEVVKPVKANKLSSSKCAIRELVGVDRSSGWPEPADFPWLRNLSFAYHGNAVLPSQFRHRGLFWLVTQALQYLLRPNAMMRVRVSGHKQARHVPTIIPDSGSHLYLLLLLRPNTSWHG